MADDLCIRPAAPTDRDAVLAVASRALGWADDERDRAFFAWKHDHNPFGASPAWVAVVDDQVVGFRTFLRWGLARGDDQLEVVRAVDTATDPAFQGRGIFRTLTLDAVDALTRLGVDAVFNTPNDQSRPGYLSMGWSELGRPSLRVMPRSVGSLARMARSRAAAEKWSVSVSVGEAATTFDSWEGISVPMAGTTWRTASSPDFLRWRYGFEPLHYRVAEVRGGACVFRVRTRGAGREVAVCAWLSPRSDLRTLRSIVRGCRADYAVAVARSVPGGGLAPLPRQGPVVTWRPLARADVPDLDDVAFSLGDLELF